MKAMFLSDLVTAKSSFPLLLGTTLVVSVFIAVCMDTVAGAIGAWAAMVPFMYLFNVSAYDEQNGWERYRLTLPITRGQVVLGRYASTLLVFVASFLLAIVVGLGIGAVCDVLPEGLVASELRLSNLDTAMLVGTALLTQTVMLLAVALSLPLILRFGMTKATRLVPMLFVFAIAVLVIALRNTGAFDGLEMFLDAQAANFIALTAGGMAVAVAFYALSAFVAVRLYARREL